jgi:hypothetical protein
MRPYLLITGTGRVSPEAKHRILRIQEAKVICTIHLCYNLPMESVERVWIYVFSLVAVINGLGIVRLLGGLSEYLRHRKTLDIQHYWVYTSFAVFQLLLHLLFWWTIIGLHKAGNLNFLSYLYLLIGPTLLFLGTSLLVPAEKVESLNLRSVYYGIRETYFSILIAFWLWVIFIWPVFGHSFAPPVPLHIAFLLIALILRITDQPRIHATLIIANYAIYLAFIMLYATHLGELGRRIAG